MHHRVLGADTRLAHARDALAAAGLDGHAVVSAAVNNYLGYHSAAVNTIVSDCPGTDCMAAHSCHTRHTGRFCGPVH
ncbi:hypothetical protein IWW35_006104 [Coemansia sp. RSA 1878]|nr:hypothetical protein IWW35_006104 [Coemansia sp. RSA 1878]